MLRARKAVLAAPEVPQTAAPRSSKIVRGAPRGLLREGPQLRQDLCPRLGHFPLSQPVVRPARALLARLARLYAGPWLCSGDHTAIAV